MGVTITSALKLSSLRDLRVLWLTLLGLGFLKPAPGTIGSLLAVILWWFFFSAFQISIQLIFLLTYTAASVWLCKSVIEAYELQDPAEIIADEFAGMWLALLFVPRAIGFVIAAFVLFRLLDIFKPYLIGWVDRNIHGGVGVMMDDLLAGAATGLILVLVNYVLGI